jgi:hypothetical protein
VIGFGHFAGDHDGVGAAFRYVLPIPAWKTLSAALRGTAICARLRSEATLD